MFKGSRQVLGTGGVGMLVGVATMYAGSCEQRVPVSNPNGKDRGLGFTHIAGGRLNKKDGLTRYGDSHVKDKTS